MLDAKVRHLKAPRVLDAEEVQVIKDWGLRKSSLLTEALVDLIATTEALRKENAQLRAQLSQEQPDEAPDYQARLVERMKAYGLD